MRPMAIIASLLFFPGPAAAILGNYGTALKQFGLLLLGVAVILIAPDAIKLVGMAMALGAMVWSVVHAIRGPISRAA